MGCIALPLQLLPSMLFGGAAALLLLNAAASLASPSTKHHAKQRSAVSIGPQPAYRPMPASPARNKTCVVPAAGDGSDDGPAILEAFKSCSPGGSVVMSANTTYTIGTALDLTFLEHVDWGESFFFFFFSQAESKQELGTGKDSCGKGANRRGQMYHQDVLTQSRSHRGHDQVHR